MNTENTCDPRNLAIVKVPGELVSKVFRVVEILRAPGSRKRKKAVQSLLKAAARL